MKMGFGLLGRGFCRGCHLAGSSSRTITGTIPEARARPAVFRHLRLHIRPVLIPDLLHVFPMLSAELTHVAHAGALRRSKARRQKSADANYDRQRR
ncbi:MAG: hypothetical protein A2516_02620 [Alphaproteobacteria bacterium RIFOXYD12_FULL_60_8]|nr:MAG: hypothetical protein A2516_02620 [Alphaproteobacteria bacterium RIFOXYD12_FULL_60_8]